MNINNLLIILSKICMFYYETYYSKIRGIQTNIHTNKVLQNLMYRIYSEYTSIFDGDENVCSMMIMSFPNDKEIDINEDTVNNLDIIDIYEWIINWIDSHLDSYRTNISPSVVSISNLPISNYVQFDHSWILLTINSIT